MEVVVYNDFAPRKWRPKKKPEPGALKTEQSSEGSTQKVEEMPAGRPEKEQAGGAEETVRVLRVCANPRLLLCIYQDGGLDRRVLVRVGKNANFSPGMELKALRPERETEPWGYARATAAF